MDGPIMRRLRNRKYNEGDSLGYRWLVAAIPIYRKTPGNLRLFGLHEGKAPDIPADA